MVTKQVVRVPMKFKGRGGKRKEVTAKFVISKERPGVVMVRAENQPPIKIVTTDKGKFYGVTRKDDGRVFRTVNEFRNASRAFAVSVKKFWH